METNKIRLGEIATYVNGYAFKPKDRGNVGLPIVRIQDLTGNARDVGFYNGEYPKKIEINNGDILISWSASLGVYVWNKGKALLNQHIFRVVFDKGEIDKSFFVYAVRQKLKEMGTKTHGATMKHIVKKDFDAIEIPYPQINRQIEIARNMDKISSVIEKKERQLKLLDDLIQARFVEMFGTLDNPTQNFQTARLEELCSKITDGKHGGCVQEKGTKRYFVGAREIYDDKIHYDTAPEININEFEKDYKRCNVEIGDFLIVNTGATIGKSAIATDERTIHTLLQKSVALLKVRKELLNSVFLKWCYRVNTKMYMVESASAQANLLLSKIRKTKIYVPDINLQNKFASFVQQVNKSKFVIHKFLYCFIDNKQSIIKPRLNTNESGKIRGGKPPADEF